MMSDYCFIAIYVEQKYIRKKRFSKSLTKLHFGQLFGKIDHCATASSPSITAGSPASLLNNLGKNYPKYLDFSVLKNGSIISSLVIYENSVRDTVEKAIISQQDSIASKLVKIADSLAVLSSLTQRIVGLERKVDFLEALVVTRPNELKATGKKCELLHQLANKQTDLINSKFYILENLCKNENFSSLQG